MLLWSSTTNSTYISIWYRGNPAIWPGSSSEAQLLAQIGDQQFAQAKASNQAGNALQSVQQVTAALASYQKGLAIREQLLHAAPADVDAQLNAAHALNQVGTALYWSRHPADAATAIQKMVRLYENIIDAHHGTPQIQVQLLWGLYALSVMSDNPGEARDDLRKSLAIATELDNHHEDPDEMTGVVTFLQDALAKLLKAAHATQIKLTRRSSPLELPRARRAFVYAAPSRRSCFSSRRLTPPLKKPPSAILSRGVSKSPVMDPL